jgi:cyclase
MIVPAGFRRAFALCTTVLLACRLFAQQSGEVEITTRTVAEGLFMLTGGGGNIGVSIGNDGVLLVDDQYASLHKKIATALSRLTLKPVRIVVNTHWHKDHTEGNQIWGDSGAVIIAQEKVRQRLATEQAIKFFNRRIPASPRSALPIITFADSITLHLNDEEIRILHLGPAHTDGDAIVFFRKAHAVHTGDLYFAGGYPFIDVGNGASVDGVIQTLDRVLDMIDNTTKVIPGHGSLSNREEMLQYRNMLVTIRDRVKRQIEAGKTLDDVVASKPTADFDKEYARFFAPELFVKLLYQGLSLP